MKILVTGGTGFIGEHFIPDLIKEGHEVVLLVRNEKKAHSLFQDTCQYWVGDVTDQDSIKDICQGIDVVYHMVAKVGNELPNEENFAAFRKVNVEGTKNILQEAKKSGVSRFIFVSSIAAMGIVKDNPITENSKCNPYLPYQVTKFEAEEQVRKFHAEGVPSIIIRPTKVYGIGEHEYSYKTLAKLCKKGFFLKVGGKKNYISNLYIDDFVQALVKLVQNGKPGETYIISSADSIPFIEAGKTIANVIGKKIRIIRVPAFMMIFGAAVEERLFLLFRKKPIVTKKNIQATITDRVYDLTKAEKDIGYKPQMKMKDGIEKTINWYIAEGII